MMTKAVLKPTTDQTFEIVGGGPYDFTKALDRARDLQSEGRMEDACNERFQAFQLLMELMPDEELIMLEWEHRNTQAALELLHDSAIDHFLVNDFEMSAAQLELLLDLDPEDHTEATVLLAFNYVAMDEQELFDDVVNDIPDQSASRQVLMLWAAFRRDGAIPEAALKHFRTRFTPWFDEFTSAQHEADDSYLSDIDGERPTLWAQARELWLQTEHLWAFDPGFIEALRSSK